MILLVLFIVGASLGNRPVAWALYPECHKAARAGTCSADLA